MRVETLEDGYDCLEELVFTPVIKNVLVKYMNGMVTARILHDDLAMITRTEVEKALAGTDTSNLKASFRQAISYSIPPITLYRNYRPSTYSDSNLIFGVPLVDLTTNRDNVPQVMRMCIEEVEKRGLNISKIYSVDHPFRAEVLQFRRRFENEKSFSFSSADNIHSVAMLLMLYLLDLPEPLFILSLRDYRNYGQNRARYAKNGFSLLRSKIRELPPVQRASLEALLRHLLRVSSHSDKNGMTVKSLAANFRYAVLRGNEVLQDGVSVKGLVLEDLIQNAQALFDKCPPPTPPRPVTSPHAAETTSTFTHSSFLSPDSSQSAEAQAAGSSTRHPSTPTQSSFSPSPSDPHAGRRPAPTVPPARHTSWASLLKGAYERTGDVNARPGDT
ncbi:Rho GTPase activation protein [Lactarius sanguifluus]|nr:Rho GTPase activation protein [Lactarius sanguifluus]